MNWKAFFDTYKKRKMENINTTVEIASLHELLEIANASQIRSANRYARKILATIADPFPCARENLIARSLRRSLKMALNKA